MSYELGVSISHLKRTAPRTISSLQRLGITSLHDLIHYYPFRYEDYSHVVPISTLKTQLTDSKYTIQGHIQSFSQSKSRYGKSIQRFSIADESGSTQLTWFNQPYLVSILKKGALVNIAGKLNSERSFMPEEYEVLTPEPSEANMAIHTGRIVPIYSKTYGISTKTIREKIFSIFDYIDYIQDPLSTDLKSEYATADLVYALRQIHFPDSHESMKIAKDRLSLNELAIVQLISQLIKKQWVEERVESQLSIDKNDIDPFTESLPFTLTSAQKNAIDEITRDLNKTIPMNRLIQGDVGSGKTVIAASAAYGVWKNKKKTLIMAPTAILAQQHVYALENLFAGLKEKKNRPIIGLHTATKKVAKSEIEHTDIIVGTHALISTTSTFKDISLVVVDEQHKFGVAQRAKLKQKGAYPHLLSMTATPIPRTVMLTLYSELDLTVIDELPKGRKPIKSFIVNQQKRNDAYAWIDKEIAENKNQVFVVCPHIEESESETLKSVKAATVEFEKLKLIFPKRRIALLTGKMKPAEKDIVMENFAQGAVDILVSTPVVEVGIDIPNAGIIIIETPERFGLAQLHQLRGRVGRSEKQSYCLLFNDSRSPIVRKRLEFFCSTHSGFKLAQYDLENRGAGEMFGTMQHGLSELKLADLTNSTLIAQGNAIAKKLLNNPDALNNEYIQYEISKYSTDLIARD